MPNKYSPTINPGDTRTRCRYLGFRIPHDGPVSCEALEQEIIRTKDGERVLADLGPVAGIQPLDLTDPATLAAVVPVIDPATNEPTGETTTVGAVFVGLFSYIHGAQLARDAAAAALTPPAAVPQEIAP
jgi:hypothetical protein